MSDKVKAAVRAAIEGEDMDGDLSENEWHEVAQKLAVDSRMLVEHIAELEAAMCNDCYVKIFGEAGANE